MRSPIPDYLLEVLDSCGADAGAVADYIPELAAANPERFGICVATVDGAVYAAGDADVEFTIQSMSKPFTYALALADRGVAEMDERVGVETSRGETSRERRRALRRRGARERERERWRSGCDDARAPRAEMGARRMDEATMETSGRG